MQKQTIEITRWLRERARTIRPNNLKISGWVEEYIEQCVLYGKPIEILTQICLSKDLENRYRLQGDKFIPLPTERDLFVRHIPQVIKVFQEKGFILQWYITFNGSHIDEGRIGDVLTNEYCSMIEGLGENKELLFLNWEKDILSGQRPEANQLILERFESLVPTGAFEIDITNTLQRVRKYQNPPSEEEIRMQGRIKVACEAEEGRFIFSPESPFSCGDILIVPLEFPERFVFFEVLAPGFQKRIAPILPLYPWRMDASELKYE